MLLTAEQWDCTKRRHSPGASRCKGRPRGTEETWAVLSSVVIRVPVRGFSFQGTNRTTLFFCPFSSLIWRLWMWSKGTFPEWSLICWRRGSRGSHPCLSRVMSSALNHFFLSSAPLRLSLTALLRVGLTAPDLVQLQWSSGRQQCLLNSFYFPLLLRLCFSSFFSLSSSVGLPFSLQHLFFFPLSLLHGAQSSAGRCSRGWCAALLSHSFCWLQRLNGRAQRRWRAPLSAGHSTVHGSLCSSANDSAQHLWLANAA